MYLIFYILLIKLFLISSTENKNCTIYGSITKKNSITITFPNHDYCVYLDTNEFDSDIKEIIIYVTVCRGQLIEFNMYYDSNNFQPYKGQSLILNKMRYYDYEYYVVVNDYIYEEFTYYFKIPKPTYRYLYLSIPNTRPFSSRYKIQIGVSSRFPLWLIISIIILVAPILLILIKIICKKIKRKTTSAQYNGPEIKPPPSTYTQMQSFDAPPPAL